MKLWEFIKQKMHLNPLQQVCENDLMITYDELVTWSEQFSKKLKGVSCCAIVCSSEMRTAMALLSCFASGVCAVPLSKRYGEMHCKKILDFISPDAVITDEEGEFNIQKNPKSRFELPNKNTALIMCTSGTRGTPKGAMLSENNIITNIKDISEYFEICNNDTILISRPLYHCAALTGEFLTALIKGTKIRFYSEPFNPAKINELIEKYFITVFCGTPSLLSMMVRFKRTNKQNSLKHICISGECMSREVGDRIRVAFPESCIYSIYGLTEACPRVSYLPPEYFSQYSDCVGIPLKSVTLKIILENGLEAKSEQIGVLWVKGGNVMSGYYKDPEKTDKVLKDDWLCTGDLAMINRVGFLKIIGRNDDMIIKAGMNIYPQEIERTLKIDLRVKETLVFARYDEKQGVQIILDIVGDFEDVSEVQHMCRELLPIYEIPQKINLLSEIPKNGTGKIIRNRGV